jgi:F0F1-type ATP synthase membrane subunit c/vacuolar-type H+-ATPase subunit K
MKKNPAVLAAVFVLSIVGLVVGFVLRTKNIARVHECDTTLGRAGSLVSRTIREACTTAKTMTNIGTALAIGCGIIAAIVIVIAIVQFVNGTQSRADA